MPRQKSKGRTGLRSLEDNALLLLVFAISLAFAWILWPFSGALLWAAVLAIVFTPLHEWLLRAMPKRQNLPALATVLIILTLVILPLTLIAASLVQEAANFHENMQGGSWNPGAFFQQFLAVLPSWATDLLDRLGLKDLAAVQAKLSDALGKGSVFFASEALDIGLGTINFLVSFAIMLYLLFFFVRDAEGLTRRITHAIPLPPEQQHALVDKSTAVIRATFKGNLLVAAVQGALGGLIFWFLGINAPVLWAVVMALCSLLPAVGAAIVWFPVAVYFLATGSFGRALCCWPTASSSWAWSTTSCVRF